MTITIHSKSYDDLSNTDIEPWRDIPAAVAADLAPESGLDIEIRPLNPPGKQPKLLGRAVTAACTPPDFGAVMRALELVGPGRVLVIAAGGQSHAAMIGEVLCGHLREKGASGLVCDGAVRDVATLASWDDFSVFTRSVNPYGPQTALEGAVQAPVKIGDVVVSPGDLILGDDDGLVALSPEDVRGHIEAAKAKLVLEEEWIKGLSAGRSLEDIFSFPMGDVVQED